MEPSVDEIQEILRIFLDSQMQEIHLELGDVKVLASKRGSLPTGLDDRPFARAEPAAPVRTASTTPSHDAITEPAVSAGPTDRDGLVEVTAPLLGTFYRCPAPGQPPFVEVGSAVEAQDPVCIIEVMKLFNRVPAGHDGKIREIVVEDGAMVEFGQTLMWIEPADAR